MSDVTLNKYHGEGDDAVEAAFTPSPSTAVTAPENAVLFVNKEDPAAPILKWWDGANFITLVAPGAAPFALIEEKTPSAVGTITFSSLGTFTHLEIRYAARSTQVATLSDLNVQFNGDTGANYDTQVCTTVNTTVSAGEGVGLTFIGGSKISAASAPAGACGAGTIRINDYRGTTFYKALTADMMEKTADASGGLRQTSNTGQWRNTAAITSITLVLGSGNYVAGSKFSLFGLR